MAQHDLKASGQNFTGRWWGVTNDPNAKTIESESEIW